MNRIISPNPHMSKLPGARAGLAQRVTRPFVSFLARTSISPSAVTWTGFVLSLVGAVLIANGYLFVSAFVVLAGAFLDMIDGALARQTSQVTRFGAVLDSFLDRVSEAALLLGIIVLYSGQGSTSGVLVTGVALAASQMVSYLRARAEALGLEGKEGLFTRPERIVVLTIGLLLGQFQYALFTAIAIIAVLSFITMIQRAVGVWRQTRD